MPFWQFLLTKVMFSKYLIVTRNATLNVSLTMHSLISTRSGTLIKKLPPDFALFPPLAPNLTSSSYYFLTVDRDLYKMQNM